MRKPRWRRTKAVALVAFLATGVFAVMYAWGATPSRAEVKQVFTIAHSNDTHYVLGPSGYSMGNDTLIVAGSQVPTLGDGDHVVICHALGEDNKDTYVQIAPSTGVVFGHAGAGHQLGQDIIPPFKYQSNSGKDVNNTLAGGQNWDAAHILIYNNGCVAQTPTTSSTTTSTSTSTSTTTTTTSTSTTTTTHEASLRLIKHFVGQSGHVNFWVNNRMVAANVGDGGVWGPTQEEPGAYNIAETEGSDTKLADYTSAWTCYLGDDPSQHVLGSGTGTSIQLTLAEGQAVTCTFVNSYSPKTTSTTTTTTTTSTTSTTTPTTTSQTTTTAPTTSTAPPPGSTTSVPANTTPATSTPTTTPVPAPTTTPAPTPPTKTTPAPKPPTKHKVKPPVKKHQAPPTKPHKKAPPTQPTTPQAETL